MEDDTIIIDPSGVDPQNERDRRAFIYGALVHAFGADPMMVEDMMKKEIHMSFKDLAIKGFNYMSQANVMTTAEWNVWVGVVHIQGFSHRDYPPPWDKTPYRDCDERCRLYTSWRARKGLCISDGALANRPLSEEAKDLVNSPFPVRFEDWLDRTEHGNFYKTPNEVWGMYPTQFRGRISEPQGFNAGKLIKQGIYSNSTKTSGNSLWLVDTQSSNLDMPVSQSRTDIPISSSSSPSNTDAPATSDVHDGANAVSDDKYEAGTVDPNCLFNAQYPYYTIKEFFKDVRAVKETVDATMLERLFPVTFAFDWNHDLEKNFFTKFTIGSGHDEIDAALQKTRNTYRITALRLWSDYVYIFKTSPFSLLTRKCGVCYIPLPGQHIGVWPEPFMEQLNKLIVHPLFCLRPTANFLQLAIRCSFAFRIGAVRWPLQALPPDSVPCHVLQGLFNEVMALGKHDRVGKATLYGRLKRLVQENEKYPVATETMFIYNIGRRMGASEATRDLNEGSRKFYGITIRDLIAVENGMEDMTPDMMSVDDAYLQWKDTECSGLSRENIITVMSRAWKHEVRDWLATVSL